MVSTYSRSYRSKITVRRVYMCTCYIRLRPGRCLRFLPSLFYICRLYFRKKKWRKHHDQKLHEIFFLSKRVKNSVFQPRFLLNLLMKVSNKNWNDAQIWFKKYAIFYRNVFHARMIAHPWEVRHFDMTAVLTADFLGTFKSSVGSACTSVTIVSSGFGHSYGDLLTLVVTDYSTQMIQIMCYI